MAKRQRESKYRTTTGVPPLVALTPKQKTYIEAIQANDVVISTGYAGTGKTFIAATIAADMYRAREIDTIILTRPNVSAGKSIGYFPGTLEEKMDPWMRPLTERIRSRLGAGVYDTAIKNGNISVQPFETMRGSSFNGFVILDEAQNVSPHEIKMFLTRYESGKIVVNGDVFQSDLSGTSGLKVLTDMCRDGFLSFPHIEFDDPEDIVRSGVCRDVILAFDNYGM